MTSLISRAPHLVSASRHFVATPEAVYDALMAAPLEELLTKRSGPIPAVKETTKGVWAAAGDQRTIKTADGGTMIESLVTTERPAGYRYRLTDFHGPMKPLVRLVEGQFAIVAESDGARVTWSWLLHPTHPVTRLVLPPFGFFWQGTARCLFDRLGERIR